MSCYEQEDDTVMNPTSIRNEIIIGGTGEFLLAKRGESQPNFGKFRVK